MAGAVRSFACSHFAAKQSPAARPQTNSLRGLQKETARSPHASLRESWRCCAFCALHYLEKVTTLLSVLNELCAGCVLLRNYLNCLGCCVRAAGRLAAALCLLFAFKNRSSRRAVCHCLLKISTKIIITDGPFNA